MKLLLGKDQLVAQWVAERIPHMRGGSFGPCVAMGVTNDEQTKLLGAVVYHDYRESVRSIEWSAAAETANWLSLPIINTIMAYPFGQLNCVRITAVIPRRNERSRTFQKRFGFKQEGLVRRGFGGDDAAIYGLLKSDWAKSPFNLNRIRAVESKAA